MSVITDNLRKALDDLGWDDARLCAELRRHGYSVSTQSTRRWYVGEADPSLPALQMMVMVVGISLDKLCGTQPAPERATNAD